MDRFLERRAGCHVPRLSSDPPQTVTRIRSWSTRAGAVAAACTTGAYRGVRRSAEPSTANTRTSSSAHAVIRRSPLRLNVRALTGRGWLQTGLRNTCPLISQTRATWLAMARRFPSGLKANAWIGPWCLILASSSPSVTFRISASPETESQGDRSAVGAELGRVDTGQRIGPGESSAVPPGPEDHPAFAESHEQQVRPWLKIELTGVGRHRHRRHGQYRLAHPVAGAQPIILLPAEILGGGGLIRGGDKPEHGLGGSVSLSGQQSSERCTCRPA